MTPMIGTRRLPSSMRKSWQVSLGWRRRKGRRRLTTCGPRCKETMTTTRPRRHLAFRQCSSLLRDWLKCRKLVTVKEYQVPMLHQVLSLNKNISKLLSRKMREIKIRHSTPPLKPSDWWRRSNLSRQWPPRLTLRGNLITCRSRPQPKTIKSKRRSTRRNSVASAMPWTSSSASSMTKERISIALKNQRSTGPSTSRRKRLRSSWSKIGKMDTLPRKSSSMKSPNENTNIRSKWRDIIFKAGSDKIVYKFS